MRDLIRRFLNEQIEINEQRRTSNTEDFINKAKQVHGDKYSYDKTDYKNARQPVVITCPEHGDFVQTPNNHLSGNGCKQCGYKSFWNKETLRSEAKKYFRLSDFETKNQYAYNLSKKFGKEFFDDITSHMPRPRTQRPYTDQELIDIALQYGTKKDFMQNDNGAYQVAIRRGTDFYQSITSHMKTLGSKSKRLVYAYFFPQNNAVYVGLTYNVEERNLQHLVSEKHLTAVRKFITLTNETPKLVKLTDYIDVEDASKKEGDFVETFGKQGYIILNKTKTGGVGHGLKYSDEDLVGIASKYTKLKDFYTNDRKAYKAARRRGVLDSLTKNMERSHETWTKDKVLDLAKKYDTFSKFSSEYSGAIHFAKKEGFIDDIRKNMKVYRRTNVTPEEVRIAAKNYETIKDFQERDPANFASAKRLGIFDEVTKNMKRLRKKNFTDDDLRLIAQSHETIKDFHTKDRTAYMAANRRGQEFFREITSHIDKKKGG